MVASNGSARSEIRRQAWALPSLHTTLRSEACNADGWHTGCTNTGRGIDYAKLIATLFILAVFAGCVQHASTEPSASPKLNGKVGCEAEGGKWSDLTRRCDPDY
jgi:hypothetical protein